jgi:EmrB/QacA subfamily drug resistance transporter
MTDGPGSVSYGSAKGRWILLATVLGSGMAFLDATVVNIALPAIGEDFDAGLASLQWTVNAYTLTLAGLLLLGGALGDRFGRRRVFMVGVAWFAVASLVCALAPTVETLIAARALQGVGGALLTPGSLAIIEASFRRGDRGVAIGAWSGLAGVSTAIGPFLGGWLIESVSWRLIFLINLPLAGVVLLAAWRHVPESRDEDARGRPLDWQGTALAAVGLAGVVYALTAGPEAGWDAATTVTGLLGALALVGFLVVERRSAHALMPLDLFGSRQFSAANLVTLLVYGALAGGLFLLPIQLQISLGYAPIAAGSALIPLTIVMLLLSARAGRLAGRIGPRIPMAVGPVVAAAGLALLSGVAAGDSYAAGVLPGILVFALGLSLTVAPLTSTVLAAASERRAGVASAINNTVARVAGLLAVAVIPVAVGLSGDDYRDPGPLTDAYRLALLAAAALLVAGGVLAALLIRTPAEPEGETATEGQPGCPLDAPLLGGEARGAPERPRAT